MKEKWNSPKTVIEEFVPNEYVAVCWGVACDVYEANDYEKKNGPGSKTWYDMGCTHDINHCGKMENQVLKDYNNDGKPDEMIEIGTDGLGNLPCNISGGSLENIKVGDYIYWTTSAADGRIWHHQGTVVGTKFGRPNAS